MTQLPPRRANRLEPPWWDAYSDQPYQIARAAKPRESGANLVEYLKVAATGLGLAPAVALRYLTLSPSLAPDPERFVGLSVSPDPKLADATVDLVDELGVTSLLLRIPTRDADRVEDYCAFMARFSGTRRFVINILQDRDSVDDVAGWAARVERIVTATAEHAEAFQVCNAINRSKWGCRHSGEYLELQASVQPLVNAWPEHRFLGSSVIDFEPLVTLRTLFNFHQYRVDGCASELYVNRRGAPENRQFGLFGLAQKIRLIAAMTSLSNRSDNALWITETNWPLLNTKPWTPNSGNPRSTVDEATQADYLKRYYMTAWNSGLVERVYWWQLINPGYGLVDHRGGRLRKLPSFDAFRQMAGGGFLIR